LTLLGAVVARILPPEHLHRGAPADRGVNDRSAATDRRSSLAASIGVPRSAS
jgi:hypothetical protein